MSEQNLIGDEDTQPCSYCGHDPEYTMVVEGKLRAEIRRLKRMLNWALKPETQEKLQADFDEHDRMMRNTGNA